MFNKIDLTNWNRLEEFKLYTQTWTSCLYTVTKKIDITGFMKLIKEKNIKFSPAAFYLVSKALNNFVNFKYSYVDKELGYYDYINPLYPSVNKDGNLSFHYIPFKESFSEFYAYYLKEQQESIDVTRALPENLPSDFYVIANVPYMDIDSFSFNLKNPTYYLLPMVEIFKLKNENGKIYFNMSLTVNHATVDFLHVYNFFETLASLFNEFKGE